MKRTEIDLRDPFVLFEDGIYYLYGTRAANFGRGVGGFDVYRSTDLEKFSAPVECFDSKAWGLNREVNWAPEVHRYAGAYYMFATFTMENGRRGTYVLRAESPLGPFVPHSKGAVTPAEWESLDGTLYLDRSGAPWLVFCHEHRQIIDGTVCRVRLSADLREAVGEPELLFAGSDPAWSTARQEDGHYITDGPFFFRTEEGALLMLWSTFINEQYAQCVARFAEGELAPAPEHLAPIITNDGGHGMIFRKDGQLMLTYHTPNIKGQEHPAFRALEDLGDSIRLA